MFSCEYCKIFKNSFFKEHFWFLRLKRSYATPPQELCILMNVYDFFKFFTLISWYRNTSWAIPIHDICHDSAGRERIFNSLSKFYNLISIAYCYRQGHSLADKYMAKVIFCHKKISFLFIMKSLLNVNVYTSNDWYKYSDPSNAKHSEFSILSKFNFFWWKTYFPQFFDKFFN